MSAFGKLSLIRSGVLTPFLFPATRMAFLLVAVSSVTGATTVSGTCSSITNHITELTAVPINCTQFNPAMGTLTSIMITISGSISGSISLTNGAVGPETVTGTTNSAFTLHTPLAGFSFSSPLFTASLTTGSQTIASGATASFPNLLSGVSTNGPLTDSTPGTFPPYEGTGTFPVTFDTATSLTVLGGGGNVSATEMTLASANVTVTYTFSPPPLTITCSLTGTTGQVGVPYTSTAPTVSGGTPPYTFSIVGTLPPGLTLNTATGVITGTPTAMGSFSEQVTDSTGATAGSCPYSISNTPVLMTCSTTDMGTVGVPFNSPAPMVTGGTPPYTFFVATGSLPPGLTLNTSTGAITGTPTATGNWTIGVRDSTGTVSTDTCAFSIVPVVMTCPVSAFQVRYASNLDKGESYIDIANPGTDGAPLLGPGFGSASGNVCVNVYAFDPGEELIACCSCLITPDQTVNLGVNRDLTMKTLTGVQPTSVTVKLLATLAGAGGAGTSCTNSAATVVTATPACGLTAWGTTLHALPGSGYGTTETPFTPSTLSPGELASIGGRCASILGNGSGFGVCNSCRSGAVGGTPSQQ